jgi:hypothetical protein
MLHAEVLDNLRLTNFLHAKLVNFLLKLGKPEPCTHVAVPPC